MASLSELAGAGCDDGAGPSSSARNPVGRVADAILRGRGGYDPVREQEALFEDIHAQNHGPVPHNFLPPPPPGMHPGEFADEFHRQLHPQIGPHGELLPAHGLPHVHPYHLDGNLPPPLADPFNAAFVEARGPPPGMPQLRPGILQHMRPPQLHQPTLTLQPPPQPQEQAWDEATWRARAEQRAREHFPDANEEHITHQVEEFLQTMSSDAPPRNTFRGDEQNWADQFKAGAVEKPISDESFARALEEAAAAGEIGSWAAQFEKGNQEENPEDALAAAFNAAKINAGNEEDWQDEFNPDDFEDSYENDIKEFLGRDPDSTEYEFASDNPFLNDPAAMEAAQRALGEGNIYDAILALEAVVQNDPGNAQAWYLLGTTQAESDDDGRAIAALKRCVETSAASAETRGTMSPEVSSALLELGVSYTNELDSSRALNYLRRWLDAHPIHSDVAPTIPASDRTSADAAHGELLQRFLAASRRSPEDAELHVVLGVLHNLSREYEAAVESFQVALRLRPDDYKLWNKLGATFANSSEGGEALRSYRRAVDLRPSFVRAWVNVGTAYANQTSYVHAVRYYLKALKLNSSANHVWSYLRTTLIALGREDLLAIVEKRDLTAFDQHFES